MKAYLIRLVLLLCVCSTALNAETPVEMVIHMNKVYAGAKSFSMNIEMKMFIGNNDVTPASTYTGEAYKSGSSYYSFLMGKTTVCNNQCTVFIDDAEKIIVYGEHTQKQKKEQGPLEIPDTSVFGKLASYKFGKGSETSSRIVIVPSDRTLYKRIELLINKKTYALEEVSYSYAAEEDPASAVQKITIRYFNILFNPSISPDKFSESRFISRKKGQLSGIGKYAAYHIVEQDKNLPANIR
jgi:outer membrane lipoprotein-sorting protein